MLGLLAVCTRRLTRHLSPHKLINQPNKLRSTIYNIKLTKKNTLFCAVWLTVWLVFCVYLANLGLFISRHIFLQIFSFFFFCSSHGGTVVVEPFKCSLTLWALCFRVVHIYPCNIFPRAPFHSISFHSRLSINLLVLARPNLARPSVGPDISLPTPKPSPTIFHFPPALATPLPPAPVFHFSSPLLPCEKQLLQLALPCLQLAQYNC